MKTPRIFIVTHGAKKSGPNPPLSPAGKAQVSSLPIPTGITSVIVGTGQRFADTYRAIKDKVGDIPVKYSPLCGSADSGEKGESGFQVTLVDSTVVEPEDYIGLVGTAGVDLLIWLKSLPDNTLLCAGREFLSGIGHKTGESGRLYQYDENGIVEIT